MSTTLMTAAAVARIEKSGNDLSDICVALMRHRNGHRIITKRDALRSARDTMRSDKAIRAMDYVVWNSDDSVDLIRIGCRGGQRRITRIWDREGRAV